MLEILNGFCVKCGTPTTNEVEGKQRPFCHDCEQELTEAVSKTKTGSKIKEGKLVFPDVIKEEKNDIYGESIQ